MTPFYLRALFAIGAFFVLVILSASTYHKDTIHRAVDRVKGIKHERLAYATFLAGTVAEHDHITITAHNHTADVYFTAARLLGYHIMHKPSTRTRKDIPFVVLVTNNVPESTRDILRNDGAIVIAADPVEIGGWFHPDRWRWNDVMVKLRLWQLTQYDRILFLDSDSALVRPLDGVFDDPGSHPTQTIANPIKPYDAKTEDPIPEEYLLATFPEARHRHDMPVKDGEWAMGPDYFNAGFFMISPSETLYQHYVSLMNPVNGTDLKFDSVYPEQNLLNYAHRKDGPMPWQNIATNWNVFRASIHDVEKGVHSLHAKWWAPKLDLKEWFAKEEALMEGYYNARDEAGWEAETGVELHKAPKMKRWMKRS